MGFIHATRARAIEGMNSQELLVVGLFMLCFMTAGIFGGIALAAVMKGKKRPLYWSVPLAIVSAILFIIMMFVTLL